MIMIFILIIITVIVILIKLNYSITIVILIISDSVLTVALRETVSIYHPTIIVIMSMTKR